MRADPAWLDIGDGLVAGLVATKLTEDGQQALWALTPQRIKEQESRVITHECAAGPVPCVADAADGSSSRRSQRRIGFGAQLRMRMDRLWAGAE